MECVKSYDNTNSDGAEDGADFPDLPAPRQLRCGRALMPFGNYLVSKVTGETNTDDGGENTLNSGVQGSDHAIKLVFIDHAQWQFAA